MVRGIDVSNHQGRIDWQTVGRTDVRFAWCKATEGRSFVDPWFDRNRREARRAGIVVGAYHFARPDLNPAKAEAEHFLEVATPRPGELLPVLDLEHPSGSPAELRGWALEFLRIVERKIGAKPVFYSYPYFITGRMGSAHGLGAYPLWLASYGPNDGHAHAVAAVGPWQEIAVHQYTSRGRVAGVPGYCDLNRLVAASLSDLVYRSPEPHLPDGAPSRAPLPKDAWEWARWYLGIGEHDVRRDPDRRPDVPKRVPEAWWRAVRWYLDRGHKPGPPARDEGDKAAPPPPAGARRRRQPVKKAGAWAQRMSIRRRMASIALEIAKRPELGHYTQTRPIPTLARLHTLADLRAGKEWWGDCSGTYKWIARLAGAPDPDGLGVWGNTTTFAQHMRRVWTPALGDAVLYDGHVVMVVGFKDDEPTRDLSRIRVFSHGSESGPYGYPEGELTADYRLRSHGHDDFLGFYRIPGL